MRAITALGLAGILAASALAHDHHRNGCPLVGYGPVNPFGWTMSADLYTTDMAPSFREFRGGGIRTGTPPINSTDQRQRPPVQPRQGSIPSIVLPPPNAIPNPQLTPPPTGTPSTSPPPGPTPASVKPSSAGTGS